MQRIFFLILFIFLFSSCKHEAKKQFEVSGTIKNSNAKMVFLEETPLGSGERIIVDSSILNNDGSFHLRAKTSEESLFNLFLESEAYPFAFVINDAPKVIVYADAKNPNDYVVEGSPGSKSLKTFSMNASGKWSALYLLGREMDSLKKTGVSDSALIVVNNRGESLLNELKSYVSGFIKNSPDPITSVWALGTYSQIFSMDDYQALLNGIVKKFPEHKGIVAIKEMNDRQLAVAKQKSEQSQQTNWIGKQAPELSLPDINGNEIKLSSFKGKYVLLDFWASWCLPCRKENPKVVQAYNKYKNKNFTIFGVSLDKEKGDWLDAIQRDKLSWTQVSDLQEWSSAAVSIYGFTSIPFNVLIDPEGKIIAQGLRGIDLEKKLDEVLQ
jgi:peroxiredoxin